MLQSDKIIPNKIDESSASQQTFWQHYYGCMVRIHDCAVNHRVYLIPADGQYRQQMHPAQHANLNAYFGGTQVHEKL